MTSIPQINLSADARVAERTEVLLNEQRKSIWVQTDRLFAWLLAFEWLGGIILALWRSPRTWDGAVSRTHPHVWAALILGTAIIAVPLALAIYRPGKASTRHAIAVGQMFYSALLIHLGDGRVEMHFHVFGSLAFLAIYRDWPVLFTASAVVAIDHIVRGAVVPQSVYGIATASPWRWMEHASWVVFEDIFLVTACVRGVREMRGISERQALLEESHRTVEEKVKERTRQLEDAQQNLLKVARSAGMAEIATSVLHNVGNVLNSLNVSLNVASSKVQELPVDQFAKAINIMNEHKNDLGNYLDHDEKGRMLAPFLTTLASVFSADRTELLSEMNSLSKNVEHIKHIVSLQQSHAKTTGVIQEVDVTALLEDAIGINAVSMENGHIMIERDLAAQVPVNTDKHMVLQILINLISNAKHALMGVSQSRRKLIVRTAIVDRAGRDWFLVEVIDNGMGIDPANLTRIFNHGFTTKKDGHGFGLHSSANAARQLGGALYAHSEGLGKGATFTLELPLQQTEVMV
jgi:signal transduction histidine kinase